MKNLLLVISIVVASFNNTLANNDNKQAVSYDYCEVNRETFDSIKDSLRSETDLEFQYWNTEYVNVDYFSLSSELNMIKNGISPDMEGASMHSSWVKFANNWENKKVLGTKIYIHVSTIEVDGISITSIEFMSDKLALSPLGLEKKRELFD